MASANKSTKERRGRTRQAGAILAPTIRAASETRGFAVSRVLTHWTEIVGAEIALNTKPVEISYGRGFGATLTVLTTGSHAPMIEMQKGKIAEKVNACYGYAAIQRVRITQTAPVGFSDEPSTFDHKRAEISPEDLDTARNVVSDVESNDLRQALEHLGRNVLNRK